MGSKGICGSLPPGIIGHLQGYLEIWLEELNWSTEKAIHTAVIRLNWKNVLKTTANVYQRCNSQDICTNQKKVKYAIRCDTNRLNQYLSHDELLSVKLLASKSGLLLGRGTVSNFASLTSDKTYTSFFSITNEDKQVVAMVTLKFTLEMINNMRYDDVKANINNQQKPVKKDSPKKCVLPPSESQIKVKGKTIFNKEKSILINEKSPQISSNNLRLTVTADTSASDRMLTALQDKFSVLETELQKLLNQGRSLNFPLPNNNDYRLVDSLSLLHSILETDEAKKFKLANIEQETLDILIGRSLSKEEKSALSILSAHYSSGEEEEEADLSDEDDPMHDEEILNQLFFTSNINKAAQENLSPEKNNQTLQPKKQILKNKRSNVVKSSTKVIDKRSTAAVQNAASKTSSSLQLSKCAKPVLFHCLLRVVCGTNFVPAIKRNLYLVCRTFSNQQINQSDVCWNCINPYFNYKLLTPIKIDDDLLKRLQNNFMVVEVWEKAKALHLADELLGICKLPVHTFYLSFGDEEIRKLLVSNEKPVIAVNDYVSVMNLTQTTKIGDLKIFVAMGTQAQIEQCQSKMTDLHGIVNESHSSQTMYHCFNLNCFEIHLGNPPGSLIWGESDCFVEYTFPKQIKDGDFCWCFHKLTPRLCEPVINFTDWLQHIISLPANVSMQEILTYLGKEMSIIVYCRYYYPQEHDAIIAKTFIPLTQLLSVIASKKKSFQLKLESCPESANKVECDGDGNFIGEIKFDISYEKTTQKKCDAAAKSQSMNCVKVVPKKIIDANESDVQMKLSIERATHLPFIQYSLQREIPPNVCVSLSTSQERITEIYPNSTEPVWNWSGAISTKLLQNNRCLTLNIWHVDSENVHKDYLLGSATVDCNSLLLDLPLISGWYHIIDYRGFCQGQIKVLVELVNTKVVKLIHKSCCSLALQRKEDMNACISSAFSSQTAQYIEQSVSYHQNVKVNSTQCCLSEKLIQTKSFLLNKMINNLNELQKLQMNLKKRLNDEEIPKGNPIQNNSQLKNDSPSVINEEKTISTLTKPTEEKKKVRRTRLAAAIFK